MSDVIAIFGRMQGRTNATPPLLSMIEKIRKGWKGSFGIGRVIIMDKETYDELIGGEMKIKIKKKTDRYTKHEVTKKKLLKDPVVKAAYNKELAKLKGVRIIGVDPSLTHTGIVVLDEKGKVINKFTIIPKNTSYKRLQIYEEHFNQLCESNPTLFCMEGYATNSKWGRELAGELCGLIKLILFKHKQQLHIVAPTALKKFATGSGKGDKSQIMLAVYKKWHRDFDDEHQTDAYVIARAGLLIHYVKLGGKIPIKYFDYELEVIAKCMGNEVGNIKPKRKN